RRAATATTRWRTSSATFGWPLSARDTVATDTLAWRATSLIVTLTAGLLPPVARPRSSPHHLELRRAFRRRAAAGEHRECARLDHAPHVRAVQRQVLEPEGELDLAGFARLQLHALETAQLAHRPGDAGDVVAQVQLHHLGACARTGVGHPHPHHLAQVVERHACALHR